MRAWLAFALLIVAAGAAAQHEHHHGGSAADAFLMQQSSGTAANPAAMPMTMSMTQLGSWHLMAHGFATLD